MDHKKIWKILQEMGIADHLTCFLKNLYAGQGEMKPVIPKEINPEYSLGGLMGKLKLQASLQPADLYFVFKI